MKNWIKRYLARLAKVNSESLGNARLDCCKLNAKKQVR